MRALTNAAPPLPRSRESAYDTDMAEQPVNGAAHKVAVENAEGHVLAGPWAVPEPDVLPLVLKLMGDHPGTTVLVDGKPMSVRTTPPITHVESATCEAMPMSPTDLQDGLAVIQMANTMMWATLDRSASMQAWMLQQASAFTNDLLAQNRKLADQALELQARFQESMSRIDLMETEKKLIEHDLMARRLSRHAIAQNRAEEEAARPPPPPGQPWIEELIAGVSAFLGAQRQPPKDWPRN